MDGNGQIEIKLPNNIAFICALRAFVESLSLRLDFSPSRIQDIELAVDELCNNAMEHGSGSSSKVIIIIDVTESELAVMVRDQGGGLNPADFMARLNSIREKPASPYRERGHGVYIVDNLADDFTCTINEYGGIDARVVFHRPNAPKEVSLGCA